MCLQGSIDSSNVTASNYPQPSFSSSYIKRVCVRHDRILYVLLQGLFYFKIQFTGSHPEKNMIMNINRQKRNDDYHNTLY